MFKRTALIMVLMMMLGSLAGCSGDTAPTSSQSGAETVEITLAAYTVPKEVYQAEIIPAFQSYWQEKTGQKVVFRESYAASGSQAKAIAGGLEADVAALSLEADIELLVDAGLITHPWKDKPHGGMITQSLVVLGVEKGNPLHIRDWQDLSRDGIDVLYPNPRTSGGAMWDINAIYGAAMKMSPDGRADKEAARDLLAGIHKNVKVMDKSGRESMTTFEKGMGDVVVTYENELLLRNRDTQRYDIVYPRSTILIENPAALVDKNVDKHGNREVVEAFMDFLWSQEVQESFANYGFRSVEPAVAEKFADQYPQPELLFDISYLGGWAAVKDDIYGPNGVWAEVAEGKKVK